MEAFSTNRHVVSRLPKHSRGEEGGLTDYRTEFLKDFDDPQRFSTVRIETSFVRSGFNVVSCMILRFGISFGVRSDVYHDEMRTFLDRVGGRFVSCDTKCSSGVIDGDLRSTESERAKREGRGKDLRDLAIVARREGGMDRSLL